MSREVGRQALGFVGFFVYSFALVAAVTGPPGWTRWVASFACTGGALLMGWGWGWGRTSRPRE